MYGKLRTSFKNLAIHLDKSCSCFLPTCYNIFHGTHAVIQNECYANFDVIYLLLYILKHFKCDVRAVQCYDHTHYTGMI